MVSVVMITYGHDQFISQAIEGVLMQKCDFDIELIIANDCSPDNTDEVVRKIIHDHPNANWIKYTKHNENKGMMSNFIWAMRQAEGKYIALCEGDDYWIDPLKLQKQVDFLENNEEYVCCLTESFVGDSRENNKFSKISKNSDISSVNILVESFFATNTFVFRNNTIDISNKIFLEAPLGDTLILYLLSLKGKIKYLTSITGYYRKHIGGVYTGADYFTKIERQIDFYKLLLSYKYLMHEKLINKLINSMYLDLAYNYSYNGKRVEAISSFKKISWFYYFINYKKIIKTIFHLAVK